MNIDLYNKQLEACLKTIRNFGSTTYINICDGSKNVIPWGGTDWALLIFSGMVMVGLGLFFLAYGTQF